MKTRTVPVRKILVVDDDPSIRLLVSDLLTPKGFQIHEATSGEQALDLVIYLQPDLILLDVQMPGMDGMKTCQRIRQLPGGALIPIMMVTGVDAVDCINRAFASGATDFITKPLSLAMLEHRIRYILRSTETLNQLHESETRLVSAQRMGKLGYWEFNFTNSNMHISAATYRIFGRPPEGSLVSMPEVTDALTGIPQEDFERINAALLKTIKSGEEFVIDFRFQPTEDEIRILRCHGEITYNTHHIPVMLRGAVQDITERKHIEDQIRTLTFFDGLTGLANRNQFKADVTVQVALSKAADEPFAILLLDLDRFKNINDSLGHLSGDLLLQEVAQKLQWQIDNHQRLLNWPSTSIIPRLARISGDEFAVVISEYHQPEHLREFVHYLLSTFSKPFYLLGQELFISASIGIASYPKDGQSVEELMQNADAALFHAKKEGRNTYQFFSQEQQQQALEQLNLENGLRRALKTQQLELHYQPQYSLSSGEMIGAEALLRCRHKLFRNISASKYIAIAEESELISELGRWVIEQACKHMGDWLQRGIAPEYVSINLSSRQFGNQDLLETILNALKLHQVPARCIELELTERTLMHNVLGTLETLNIAKDLGMRTSVDDFGTGYCSLSYLRRFPLDSLKIDQSFIKDLLIDKDDAAITMAIINMAHSLNLKVIAEGVENAEQKDFLVQNGCDFAQGYFYSKPLPFTSMEQLLSDPRPDRKFV